MDKDILDRLRDASESRPIGVWTERMVDHILREAADEIEHLRSVAGAVSQGQTFEQMPRGRIVYDSSGMATLKAFDGA